MALIVCPEPPAAAIGARILSEGGNAADAAIAAGFAQGVANPFMCGLSGTAILLHQAPDGTAEVLNGEAAIGRGPVPEDWIASVGPRAEAIGRYPVAGERNQIGPASAMVPGFVALCAALHDRHASGRFTWAELLAPAADLARGGFAVYPYVAALWGEAHEPVPGAPAYPSLHEKFARSAEARRVFLHPGGAPYRAGEILRQPDLAATLDHLGRAGAADFYRGEIAARMAAELAAGGSLVTAEDLAAYRVVEQRPLAGRFRGHDLCTTPPPSPGVQVLEMLGIVDALEMDLRDLDSPAALDLLCAVMRAGFADNRDIKAVDLAAAGDWAAAMTHPARAARWADRIRGAGVAGPPPARSTGTTHLVAVDDSGAAVSFTHSIGSTAGAGAVAPGLGFLHNNFLGHFDPRPGGPMSIRPGRRIGSGMPTIVRRDGRLKLVIGAPGGSRIITSIFQVLLDVLGRATPVDAAVRRLRVHSEEEALIHLEPGWPEAVQAALRAAGRQVRLNPYQARVQAIEVTPAGLRAGVDPRGGAAGHSTKEAP